MSNTSDPSSGPRRSLVRNGAHRPVEVWRELVSSRRRWAHKTFTRQHVWDAIKTMAWVLPLTILIWFYAEREQLVPMTVQFPIEVKSADPAKRLVTLLPPADRGITAELVGPMARINEAKKEIEMAGPTPAVQIEVDASLAPGQTYDVRTTEQLNGLAIFKKRGIGVGACQPPVLRVFVDQMEEREVAVRVPPGVDVLESATFDPPTAKVKGPAATLGRLEKEGRLVLYADVADLAELKAPGQHERAGVGLRYDFHEAHITVLPSAVKAVLRVRQSDVEFKIPSIPVFVVSPQGLLDKYKVTYSPTLPNVTVVGPPDKIELLGKETLTPKPKATLELSREDGAKPGQPQFRQVRYELPEGVRVKDEDAKREVEFKLTERGTAE